MTSNLSVKRIVIDVAIVLASASDNGNFVTNCESIYSMIGYYYENCSLMNYLTKIKLMNMIN